MILSEKQREYQAQLDTLRKQIDLLDSHKTVGLITNKQYNKSLGVIVAKVEELEKEFGIIPPQLEQSDLDALVESTKRVYGLN